MNQLNSPTHAKNPQSIQDMFGTISEKYDLANSVLSFGIHHRWKKRLVREAKLKSGAHVLDCATGTGDLAFLFETALRGMGSVTGTDFCQHMLDVAMTKAKEKKSQARFKWADVMDLPFPDATFDVASISFGIRNVKDSQKALTELGRVLKPGGRLLVLEFGQPRSPIISALFGFYSTQILPRIGGWISGKPEAYQYLNTSSAVFPCGPAFLKIAEATRLFSSQKFQALQFGIAYLYLLDKVHFSANGE